MKNRIDIKDFILFIEKNYAVNNWKFEGIHLWPIIRIWLYFYLMNQIESSKKNLVASEKIFHPSKSPQKQSFYKKGIIRLKKKAKKLASVFYYYHWLHELPKKKYVFWGGDAHRVNYKNKRYNRYFDIFIEKYKILHQSLMIEYDQMPIQQYQHKDIVKHYHRALHGFVEKNRMFSKSKNIAIELEGYDDFIQFLAGNTLTNSFAVSHSKLKLIDRVENYMLPKIIFFKQVLKKIQPQKVLILCYYSEDIMALTVAANQLGIDTVEMQHGPQVDIHLSYGNWSNVPKEGYDMLPRNFWCWDEYSKQVLDTWINKSNLYHSKVVGNPWVDYWKTKKESYPHADYILYSLQPTPPLTIPQLFPQVVIDFIKNQPYTWFIRLHPRQLEDRDAIGAFLKAQEVLHLVNIEEASNDALPQLLINSKIHVTHFSGSTIEAGLFDVFTVLINEISVNCFPEQISKGQAVFLDTRSNDFTNQLINIIEAQSNRLRNNIFAVNQKDINLFE